MVLAAIDNVLKVYGIDICNGEWGKPLGGGLYEFRIRKPLHMITVDTGTFAGNRPVLLRLFCTFYGNKAVLLYHGYDKKADPSVKRQQHEIAKARKLHQRWKRRQ